MRAIRETRGFPDGSVHRRTRARENESATKESDGYKPSKGDTNGNIPNSIHLETN